MENKNLEIQIIAQLILEYRTSLETISKIFNIDSNELYGKLMEIDNSYITRALEYVLNYETVSGELVDQEVAKRQARAFLTRFYMAKNVKEKMEIIKTLDNSAEIEKLKSKPIEEYNDCDYEKLLKHRYKYAISKREIFTEFDITRVRLENREKLLDAPMKKRVEALNEYNNHNNYYNSAKRR